MEYIKVILPIGGVIIGALASYFLVKPKSKIIEEAARREAEALRDNAGKESKRIIKKCCCTNPQSCIEYTICTFFSLKYA